jgi:hypothetical protein
MKAGKLFLAALVGASAGGLGAQAQTFTRFSYTQTDTTTGVGTIQGFTYDPGDGGGPITFGPTAMPAAALVNPSPAATPAGYVGAITEQAGISNEANKAVGLTFSGFATTTGTRGANTYKINIPLVFVPKQTQSPDANDYTWSLTYGDNPAAGTDASSTAGMRFALWLSRDTLIDSLETANTFQRYTQETKSFVSGQDTFTDTDTTTTAIKDAVDGGDPQGTDAAGHDLAFYFGWRDQGGLSSGAVLVDDFAIGGLLGVDQNSLALVPEPSVFGLIAGAGLLGLRRNGRRHRRA